MKTMAGYRPLIREKRRLWMVAAHLFVVKVGELGLVSLLAQLTSLLCSVEIGPPLAQVGFE
jgi:hypothetical protein